MLPEDITNSDNISEQSTEGSIPETEKKDSFESKVVEETTKPKKRKKRPFLWLFLFLLIGLSGWFGYKFAFPKSTGPRINPLNLVPADAFFVLETDRPYGFWEEMGKTKIWNTLIKDDEWKTYGEQLNELESTLSNFDRVLDVLSNRTVYMSGHIYRKGQYDYLFILDMEGMGVLRTYLTSKQNLTKREFKNYTLYEQLDPSTKETLYFTFIDNYFVGAYTHTLVESAIGEIESATLSRSFDFIEVRKKAIGEGLVRLYLNYDNLYPYLEGVLGTEYTNILEDNLPLHHSGCYFDVDERSLLLEGFSNYNDSLSTYLEIFQKSGEGGLDIAKVLPARTSLYFSLGFDSFSKFYQALDEQLRQDPEYGEDYATYTKKTEKFLNISLEEDLAGWVDDEIAVIQLESSFGEPELALIFKAKSASLAQEKMDFLSRQIRRKTPVKFKSIVYKGYPINFMSVKGIFNLVLGNLFKYFDRPYYTIIDEYVVFSNQPQVLRRMINDWLEEKTLDNVESFKDFKNKIGEDHSALLYLQLPLLEKSNGGMIDAETIELLREKRAIVNDFPQLAFKLLPSGNLYKTKALVSIDNVVLPEPTDYTIPFKRDSINYDSLLNLDPGEQIEVSTIDIEIDDLGAKKQSEEYEGGALRYEVDVKNGLKHGHYFEYHETGELKIKGKYKNDQMDGAWKYYDENGELVKRERYKNGALQ